MSNVIFYAANTVDSYIAGPKENPLGYLDQFNETISLLSDDSKIKNSYSTFIKDVDIYIIGRQTFSDVLELSDDYMYKNTVNYVVTNSKGKYHHDAVTEFIDFSQLLKIISDNPDKKIYIVGGSNLLAQLLEVNVIDKIIMTILPILLGTGVSYFTNKSTHNLKLDDYIVDGNFVELHYTIVK